MFDRFFLFRRGPVLAMLALFLLAYAYVYGWRLIGSDFIDLPAFWVAVKIAFELQLSPYGPGFAEVAEELAGGYVHPFLYPPTTLLLLAPLAAFDLEAAGTAMLAINLCAGIATGGLLALLVGSGRATMIAIALGVMLVLAAQATRQTLGHGQVNLMVLAFLLAGILALHRGLSPVTTALFLAIAILLKLYVGLILLCLVLHCRWREAAVTLAWLAVLSIGSLAAVPLASWPGWVEHVLLASADAGALAGQFDLASPRNIALTGLVLRWMPEAELARHGLAACLVLTTIAASLWLRRDTGPDLAEIGAYLCLVLLLAPNSWVHYMVFALPALYAAGATAWRRRSWLIALPVAALGLVLMQNPAGPLGLFSSPGDLLTLAAIGIWALAILTAILEGRTVHRAARP
ncbi:MAG: glycosyltransferase family 87 protein [Pseudomonadota bacterium]